MAWQTHILRLDCIDDIPVGKRIFAIDDINGSVCFSCWKHSPLIVGHGTSQLFFFGVLKNLIIVRHYEVFEALPDENEVELQHNRNTNAKPFIEFRNVSFSYPGTGCKAIDDVSFSVQRGDRIAMCGENGSGKTTILKLLLGIQKPDSGEILINGSDVSLLSRNQINEYFSVMFQDACRFDLAVNESIALSDLQNIADKERIQEELDSMELDIMQSDMLGISIKGGRELSKRQWQRLSLARTAFPKDRFLIMDEPLASLDPAFENKSIDVIGRISQGNGSLVITHRLSFARTASRIIVLDKGQIVENGIHDELMAERKLYFKMFSAQKSYWVGEKEA